MKQGELLHLLLPSRSRRGAPPVAQVSLLQVHPERGQVRQVPADFSFLISVSQLPATECAVVSVSLELPQHLNTTFIAYV